MRYLLILLAASTLSYKTFAVASKNLECVTTHYPPFAIFGEDDTVLGGHDVIILTKLAKRMDWTISVLNLPWGRVKKSIELKSFDCYFSLANIQPRPQYLDFTTVPLHVTRYALFYKKGLNIGNLKSWKTLRIAGLRGVRISQEFTREYDIDSETFLYANSNERLLQMLLLGRIDAFITNEDVGRYVTKETHNIGSVVISELDLPVFLAFKKGAFNVPVVDQHLSEVLDAYSFQEPFENLVSPY